MCGKAVFRSTGARLPLPEIKDEKPDAGGKFPTPPSKL